MLTIQISRWGVAILAITLFTSFGTLAQGLGAPSSGRRTAESESANSEDSSKVLPAQFQATVYEVQAAADRVNLLNSKALSSHAATAEALLKELSEIGKARILYRIDQPVNVYSERITVGKSEPLVTGSRSTGRGQPFNSIAYHNVGVNVRLSAHAPATGVEPATPNVKMSVQLSVLGASDTEIAPGQKATSIRTVSLEHQEPLTFNQPQVAVTVNSTSEAEQATPTAYLIRYMFSPPVGK